MSTAIHPLASPAAFARCVARHPGGVLVPAALFAALAAAYATFKPDVWEATQPFAFRNEAAGNTDYSRQLPLSRGAKNQARNNSRNGQEQRRPVRGLGSRWVRPRTIAIRRPTPRRRTSLISAAKSKCRPPRAWKSAPTEMFYIKVKSTDRDRAEKLAAAVADQLQIALSIGAAIRPEHD